MSTEQKNLAPDQSASERAAHLWQQFTSGKIISYKVMAIILIVVAALVTWWWISKAKTETASKMWMEMERATTVSELEEFAKAHPNTPAGRVAQLHVARYLLGSEGIDPLNARDRVRQQKAVENIEKAREMFAKLADEFKDDPVLKAEALLGAAKAEAALIGIGKEGKPEEFRGSVEKTIEYLDRLAADAADTPWGKDAKKLADGLRDTSKPESVRAELTRVQVGLYTLPTLPTFPGFDPIVPGGTPPSGPLPGIPGGPIAPGPTPPGGTTPNPTPPGPTPPTPTTTPPGGTAPMPTTTPPMQPGGTTPMPPTPPDKK